MVWGEEEGKRGRVWFVCKKCGVPLCTGSSSVFSSSAPLSSPAPGCGEHAGQCSPVIWCCTSFARKLCQFSELTI